MRFRGCCSNRTRIVPVAAAVAALVCGLVLLAAGVAAAARTTTTLPSTTTTTTLAPQPPPPTTFVTPTTTTTAPQHVVNQPNLDALTPHIEALSGSGVQYQSSSGPSSQGSGAGPPSFLHSPGGPYLYDTNGRIVLLHGTNVVYKHAPYIAYPDPGKPWNFSAADAARMQSLGFNVVRLGIEWQALEPGSGGPNQAKICTPGPPGNPHEFDRAVAERYLQHVAATVDCSAATASTPCSTCTRTSTTRTSAARERPTGPCAPTTCRSCPSGGRWSNNYANPQAADGRATLLVQRRGRRPPGQSRPRLGDGGGLFQEQSLGRRLRPLQRALLDRDAGRVRIDLHGPVGVLLHGEGPHRLSGQRGDSARAARPTCRTTASSLRSRRSITTT